MNDLKKIRNREQELLNYEKEKRALKQKYTNDLDKLKKMRQTKEVKLEYENRIKKMSQIKNN